VYPSGAKSYIAQRRLPNGRTVRDAFERRELTTLKDARDRASRLLRDIGGGKVPKAELKTAANLTLRTLLDQFTTSRGHTIRPKTLAGYRSTVETHLKPWLDTPLPSITGPMVEARHIEIQEQLAVRFAKRAKFRNARGNSTANGAFKTFRLLWLFAASRVSDLPPCPTAVLSRLEQPPRDPSLDRTRT
jgi:hypothetical protein